MIKTKLALLVLLFILLSFSISSSAEMINGAGATFPYPLYSSWAAAYNKATGIKVNYQSIGSGGGIRQITERTVHFGASDMALKPEEIEKSKLLQFPAVIGGVVPIVNIPGVSSNALVLDGTTMCEIFLGEIKQWNDPKIKALNPKLNLPAKPITVVHRSDGSGTTAIFTHYLSSACKKWANNVGYGTSVSWKTGLGGKGNEGVANYVKRTPYSIGYVEFVYAKQNKLSVAILKNSAGQIVAPDFESFAEAAASAHLDAKNHFYAWMTNAPGKKAWPITGATYILLAREKNDVNKSVIKFFDWAFQNGDNTAKKLDYVPLPKNLKDKIRTYWKSYIK
ncbi:MULTISPECIES: phosphate ABC transporter substrate-binding protein PstS [Thermodesulfovibrio]|uniref:phosphate ABC transporter substrate-binding protein PstS n=1 Tax=Thermodesulfovibrio TaxID=28261 RepID=UPI001143E48E|nr:MULTISPECIES: phosphate ABC transporter substrate-binding protein PstS [Thermodesulfovibrio]MDI6865586.1 phosphate ABC transporter substrate-binding protein PstS [Thermodesulfovibrio yellowstonii]